MIYPELNDKRVLVVRRTGAPLACVHDEESVPGLKHDRQVKYRLYDDRLASQYVNQDGGWGINQPDDHHNTCNPNHGFDLLLKGDG